MSAKTKTALMFAGGLFLLAVAVIPSVKPKANQSPQPTHLSVAVDRAELSSALTLKEEKSGVAANVPGDADHTLRVPPAPALVINKLERLNQIRESFRALAAGSPAIAMKAARQLTNEVERETALVTLVTQWTEGELSSPSTRARAIAAYGLEAGLGIELAKLPELAVLWANELTDGPGRTAVLQNTAVSMLKSNPSAAFALSEQLPEEQRRDFIDSVFAGWAGRDTDAALEWANQIPDLAERDGALQAIRSAAPIGIGVELSVQHGYAVVNQLLPGAAAELSGQVNPGDRIVGLAQGDNAFVDARGLPLADIVQMIRGLPGTTLQLQVLGADASQGAQPRLVAITRSQIRFKQ